MSRRNAQIKTILRYRGGVGIKSTKSTSLVPDEMEPLNKVHLQSDCYIFDHIFDHNSTQDQVYEKVAHPVLEDVLNGFSCTIFAYGQTGTGKTYTMEGDLDDVHGLPKRNSGIIPRTIRKLFELMDKSDPENHVMVSMLELYNEDLRDLFCDPSEQKPLTIVEAQKGTSFKVLNNKEVPISSAEKGLKVMKEGIKRRMTAATQFNDKSSRSHCIFTITVYLHELNDGKDEYRIGKLNLVDLAGSENSQSSGSNQARFREATKINNSLLTLGRVIEALAEKRPHVPYRESKLTKLLKDSLGGHTKTYVIATVFPEQQNYAELRNTLEYASKARVISNKLQTNRRVTQENRIHKFIELWENAQDELKSTQEKQGVYIPKSSYDAMKEELTQQKEEILSKDILIDDYKKAEIQYEEQVKTILEESMLKIKATEEEAKSKIAAIEEKLRMEFQSKEKALVATAKKNEDAYRKSLLAERAKFNNLIEPLTQLSASLEGVVKNAIHDSASDAGTPEVKREDIELSSTSVSLPTTIVSPVAPTQETQPINLLSPHIPSEPRLSKKRTMEDVSNLPSPKRANHRASVEARPTKPPRPSFGGNRSLRRS